jgi:hypothetical protein
VADLPVRLRAEIERLIGGGGAVRVDWHSRQEALDAIDEAAARWAAKVNGHG